jgi:hypothetical protein
MLSEQSDDRKGRTKDKTFFSNTLLFKVLFFEDTSFLFCDKNPVACEIKNEAGKDNQQKNDSNRCCCPIAPNMDG